MSRKKTINNIPSYSELIIPTVEALNKLGGSGSIEEINSKVCEILDLNDEIIQVPHNKDSSINEIEYRLAWSRTYLKKNGLINNSSRGIWALAKANINTEELDSSSIVQNVRDQRKTKKIDKNIDDSENIQLSVINEVNNSEKWRDQLLNVLYNITPAAFERLSQRILRESGFSQVEVTGKSGDGGIDGKGIVRVSGLLSFHVIFQCKRYRGSVTPSQIRDFRGAMQGRADKGLFITTGSFTREAIKEATRDGAPPLDLIDGDILCDKLKELQLGVVTEMIEYNEVDTDWFNNL